MEWLLLWLALSAISLEGFCLFVTGNSFYAPSIEILKELASKFDTIFGAFIWFIIVVGCTALMPIVMYQLITWEE